MRRTMRGGGGSAAAVDPIYAIFGASLVEYFDASLGITLNGSDVDSWTGQYAGLVVPYYSGGGRPTYTAANASFNNRPTVNTASTGSKCLVATSGALAAFAAGTYPYVSSVWLCGNTGGYAAQSANGSNGNVLSIRRRSSGTGHTANTVVQTTGAVQTANTVDAAVANMSEAWVDGSLQHMVTNGGGEVTGTAVGGVTNAGVKLGIGCTSSGSSPADASIAALVFAVNPTSDMRTAWNAYCQSRWGTP